MEVFSLEVGCYVDPKYMQLSRGQLCLRVGGKKCLKLKTKPATELSSHRLYQDFSNCGTRTTSGRPATIQLVHGLSKKNQRIKNFCLPSLNGIT
jgi:hypothetical protein